MAGAHKDKSDFQVRPDEIFERMVESAFDFLARSRDELEKSPKYSTIHFATAIELILKARLLKEHWTLVVAVSGDADRASFKEGRAKTVTPDQAAKRLDQILGKPVPQAALESFRRISAHRNRMIHFFHEADTAKAEEQVRTEISKEQLNAWFHLLNLVKSWRPHFDAYANNLRHIEHGMRRVREYLGVAYEALRPDIEAEEAQGSVFTQCNSCGYPAAKLEPATSAVQVADCLVCGLQDSMITLPCPTQDCAAVVRLSGWNTSEEPCEKCGQKVNQGELAEFLDTDFINHGEFEDEKNCAECMTPGSVVKHNEIFICTNCFAHKEAIYMCGWCNEMQLGGGNLDDSFLNGCEFCGGNAGWVSDD
jgi:hypothetical protein